MARLARVVVPGLPHRVARRGSRRLRTFFGAADDRAYRALLAAALGKAGVACWAYCLMPGRIHLILPPVNAAAPVCASGRRC